MTNQYSTYYKTRSTQELEAVIADPQSYEDEARLAALLELKDRKGILSESFATELQNLEEHLNTEKNKPKLDKKVTESVGESMPELYSPMAIIGFSIFFSLIFGGVLMALNLKKVGKISQATNTILFSLGVLMLAVYASTKFQLNQWVILLVNLGGSWILVEYFWKKHIGIQSKFKRKSIFPAIAVSVGVSLAFFAIIYIFFKDQLPPLQ